MKVTPIIMNGDEVRAVLDGRKTQLRRVVKPQPASWRRGSGERFPVQCPYADVPASNEFGENPTGLLWVRESFQPILAEEVNLCDSDWNTGKGYEPRYVSTQGATEYFDADDNLTERCFPSINMPRWASRLTLKVTAVKVERLRDIDEDGARAEGFDCVGKFADVWAEKQDKKHPWRSNPWVWAVKFEPILKNVDAVIEENGGKP